MTAPTWDDALVEHRYADVGGVRLHYAEAGRGPLVVLLHGFPEFWYSWKHQIPALVAAGYRVVAPDLRGYNLSGKPERVSSYFIETLAGDVEGLIRACGESEAHVVGHDWGAAVAWVFAMIHPSRLRRLAILNVPHPVTFDRGLRTWRQLKKSWYIFYFQLPWFPERMMRARGYGAVRAVLRRDPVRKDAFSKEDVARYVEAMGQPGCLTAAINYYRAIFRRRPSTLIARFRPIEKPVLVLWGEQDRYLGLELAEPDAAWVKDVRVVRFPDASHWVHWDVPEEVNRRLIGFLGGGDGS